MATNRWHINPDEQTIGRCNAEKEPCPFGGASGDENHFNSLQEAKQGYEQMQRDNLFSNTIQARGNKKVKYAQEKYVEREKVFPKQLVEQELRLHGEYTEEKRFGDVDRVAHFTVRESGGEYYTRVESPRGYKGKNAREKREPYVQETGPHGSLDSALNGAHREYKALHSRFQRQARGISPEAQRNFPLEDVYDSLDERGRYSLNTVDNVHGTTTITYDISQGSPGEYYASVDYTRGYDPETGEPLGDTREVGTYSTVEEAVEALNGEYVAYQEDEPDYEAMVNPY